jgi:hypothetical protein
MEHFWIGFEKVASLAGLAGGLLGRVRRSPSSVGRMVSNAKADFLRGYASRAKNRMPHGSLGRSAPTPEVTTPVTKVRSRSAPTPEVTTPVTEATNPSSIRSKGKAMLTGGLLGAGGTYLASTPSQADPQYASY